MMAELPTRTKPVGVRHGEIVQSGGVAMRVSLRGHGRGRRVTLVVTSPYEINLIRLDGPTPHLEDINGQS
jgi:hypothetical protein